MASDERNGDFLRFCKKQNALKYNILLLVMAVLLSQSCGTFRRASEGSLSDKDEKLLMKRMIDNQVSADWLGARAKVTYSDEYGSESFSAFIRTRKDSAIWMAFKKFSIEGVRVLITPDSVKIIDRMNGEYSAEPYEALRRKYQIPLSFQGLQALLLGNPVFFSRESEMSLDSGLYVLQQQSENLEARYKLDQTSLLLREFFVNDAQSKRSLRMMSANYQALEDKQNFSYFRSLNLASPDIGQMKVNIEFSKVEVNVPQKMDFNVPEQYRSGE